MAKNPNKPWADNPAYLKWRVGHLEQEVQKKHKYYTVDKNIKYDMYYHPDKALIRIQPIRVRYSIILKVCIILVFLMCVITMNYTTEENLPPTANITFDSAEVIEEYNLSSIDILKETTINYNTDELIQDEPFMINRIINLGRCFEIYGKSTTWVQILNTYANTDQNILAVIGKVIVAPVNITLNILQLGANIVNTLIGNELLEEPQQIGGLIWEIKNKTWINPAQSGKSIGQAIAELWKEIWE